MSDLAEYFRAQASWRRAKADDYPQDERNAQSARALDDLANYVESDVPGSIIDALEPHLFEGFTLGGEETRRAVSRYGYGYEVTHRHHEEFLEELSVLCLEDAYGFVQDQGDAYDPSETLYPFEIEAALEGVHVPRSYFERRSHATKPELEQAVAEYRKAGVS